MWGKLLILSAISQIIVTGTEALQVEQIKSLSDSVEQQEDVQEGREAVNCSSCDYKKEDFRKIVLSASRALDFFDRHVDRLVLDAAIATRIMQCKLFNGNRIRKML